MSNPLTGVVVDDTQTSEPVAWAGLVAAATTFVTAVIALLVAFGINLDPDQQKAVLGVLAGVVAFVGAVAPIVTSLRARSKVVPYKNVVARVLDDGGPLVAGPAHSAITGTTVKLPPPADVGPGDQTGAA